MSLRTLIIEDNENNMYLTAFLLEKNGFEVHKAYDGITGVDMAKTLTPELILLDIQLPKMNGYEVAQALRKDPALSKTPIIAITSYAMPGDQEKALEAGCDGYIKKPIDPDTFIQDIQTYLKRNI